MYFPVFTVLDQFTEVLYCCSQIDGKANGADMNYQSNSLDALSNVPVVFIDSIAFYCNWDFHRNVLRLP